MQNVLYTSKGESHDLTISQWISQKFSNLFNKTKNQKTTFMWRKTIYPHTVFCLCSGLIDIQDSQYYVILLTIKCLVSSRCSCNGVGGQCDCIFKYRWVGVLFVLVVFHYFHSLEIV